MKIIDFLESKKRYSEPLKAVVITLIFFLLSSSFGYRFLDFNVFKKTTEPESKSSEAEIDCRNETDASKNRHYSLTKSMSYSFAYLVPNSQAYKAHLVESSAPYEPQLFAGEILIETVEDAEGRYFKLVASKNPDYSYEVGEKVNFNPIIQQENLIISRDDGGFYWSSEFPDFKFPDSLEDGDKVAFICNVDDCSNNVLSWALVYPKYLDL